MTWLNAGAEIDDRVDVVITVTEIAADEHFTPAQTQQAGCRRWTILQAGEGTKGKGHVGHNGLHCGTWLNKTSRYHNYCMNKQYYLHRLLNFYLYLIYCFIDHEGIGLVF